ncbi:MAG TPA: group II intron reverse transcriptase/maturase [Hyphomicrobiaceae bacterium]
MTRTSSREIISTRQEKLATLARIEPKLELSTLAHHIDEVWLREAYRRTRKDGAVGVDGVTAEAYEAHLEANLSSLLGRFKSGRYRAPAVRRVHIPKDGTRKKTRPIGIPTLEDKVLQRAVLMVLEPVYEQDFLSCSYGFRPGRSAHQALQALWQGLMEIGGGWIIDLDIQSFFDDVDRTHLRHFMGQRVRDGVIRRAIGKWLNAGVMEEGVVRHPERGTPQGGVISPLLSNLYLHEVLDMWFEQEVKPRLRGRAMEIRFADDAVLAFEREEDARRVLAVLPKRFGKYGLTLHPEKTRLVDFCRPPGSGEGSQRERSFELLGFTHFWGRSRQGRWVVRRKTAKARFSRALKRVTAWCRTHRHLPVAEQQMALSRKLQGHYAYYGITGNATALLRFRYEVERCWRKWLSRRSRKARLNWAQFDRLRRRYPLPPARVVHSIYRGAATS